LIVACASTPPQPTPAVKLEPTTKPAPPKKKELVESALASGKLNLFVEALKGTAIESGTFFAPTDDAFATIEPARRSKLALHHVVLGKVLRETEFPPEGADIPTSDGTISVRAEGGEMWVDDLRVIARIEAANGIIYAIGGVVDPAAPPDVRARIQRMSPSFATLVQQSGLLDGPGPFTVFIPNDAALGTLVPPIDPKKIVSRHASRGVIASADLPKLRTLRMLSGPDLATSSVHVLRGSPAKNGMVYVIDAVLK
jgi:uncharacterized surface protein with fasciclin (FAS1) repeats